MVSFLKGILLCLLMAMVLPTQPVWAGEVEIVAVEVRVKPESDRQFSFEVTLRHEDEGWSHYADRWQVWSVDGKTQFGTRRLAHPHVKEQPFTRSGGWITIPRSVKQVLIRSRDTVHGLSSHTRIVDLP
jgi:hypothetical protein